MNYFLCRLNPSRSTFAEDMSDDERQLMRIHAHYWKGLLDRGKVLLFGPVGDPSGIWGVAVVEVKDADEVAALTTNDPIIVGNRGFSYDIFPVLPALARERASDLRAGN